MANTFQTTSKIEKAIAFQWAAFGGFADHLEFHNDELPSAVDNTGYTKMVRRPSRHASTQTAVGADYNLPGVAQPVVSYGSMVDASFPFAITARFETNLQVSFEELLFKLDRNDVMDRHLTPAIVEHQNKQNAYIAATIEAAAGNTITSGGTADGYNSAIWQARQLMINRGGIKAETDKYLLLNTGVMPTLATGNAKLFHTVDSSSQFQKAQFEQIAGFRIEESPTLSTPIYASIGASAVVASAQNITNFLTASWAPTWQVAITGATANVSIAAGAKFKFVNGSTDIRWIVPASIGTDAGFAATFTVVNAAQADSSGNITLTLSEPFIAGGDFKNVSANLVAGSTKVVNATATSTLLTPSYAFSKDAIWLGSPAVKYPSGVDKGMSMKLGGFNIALIEDHWPGTLQSITKIVSFLAIGVAKPEALTVIY